MRAVGKHSPITWANARAAPVITGLRPRNRHERRRAAVVTRQLGRSRLVKRLGVPGLRKILEQLQ